MRNLFTTALIAGALAASTAHAGIVWTESTNGELSDDASSATYIGTLGQGVSTITGSVSMSQQATGQPVKSDYDFFTFDLGTGLELVSASLTWSDDGGGKALGNVNWLIFLPPSSTAIADTDGASSFTAAVPLSFPFFGGPFLTGQTLNVLNTPEPPWSFTENYSITLNVRSSGQFLRTLDIADPASVPEPGSLALVGLGALALVAARRQRAR